jgi:hypothetical protein
MAVPLELRNAATDAVIGYSVKASLSQRHSPEITSLYHYSYYIYSVTMKKHTKTFPRAFNHMD